MKEIIRKIKTAACKTACDLANADLFTKMVAHDPRDIDLVITVLSYCSLDEMGYIKYRGQIVGYIGKTHGWFDNKSFDEIIKTESILCEPANAVLA